MKLEPTHYSVNQAARILKLSPQRIRVLLAKGRLQGYQAVTAAGRVTWHVHLSLYRRPGVAGRPSKKRRTAAAMNGGSAAKP